MNTNNAVVSIIDDDPATSQMILKIVESTGFDGACYESAEAFLRTDRQVSPGCLIVDLRLPDMNGLELLRSLIVQGSYQSSIMISGSGDIETAVRAIKLGALDFIQKPFCLERLTTSIRRAVEFERQRRASEVQWSDGRQRLDTLTTEERAVMELLVEGKTIGCIASRLDLSIRTIHLRRSNLLKKLGVGSRNELIQLLSELKSPPSGIPSVQMECLAR